MTTTHRRVRFLGTLATTALLLGVTLAACTSDGGSGDSSGAASSADLGPASLAAPAAGSDSESGGSSSDSLESRSVISTGNVELRSDDVAQALFDVQQLVDSLAGEVESTTTDTDDDGKVERSRMVVRIPTADFADALDRLEKTAVLVTSSSDTADVTTEVLDTNVRVRIQRESIDRIALLLDRAESIRDIVSIEAQLSQRQADLASLEQQQKALADQTAMSTITVSLERTSSAAVTEDDTGFTAGLSAGWHGLTTFGAGLATIAGALLPWLVVLGILAVPGWVLVRRLRRRTSRTSLTE